MKRIFSGIFGVRVERLYSSLIIRDNGKIVVWDNVFSTSGEISWNPESRKLSWIPDHGAPREYVIRQGFSGISSLSFTDAPKSPWYKWPALVFAFVILPMILMAPALAGINRTLMLQQNSGGLIGVKPGNFTYPPGLPSFPGPGGIKTIRDSSWMKK